jgi:PKD repeat protein
MKNKKGGFNIKFIKTTLFLIAVFLLISSTATAKIVPVNNQITWDGVTWNLEQGNQNNVWIDDAGLMHNIYDNSNGIWTGTSLVSNDKYLYGKYIWKVHSGSLNYPLGTSVAMFTYTDDLHELDIEIEQWPGYDQHLWYTVQPGQVDSRPDLINYSVPSNSPHINAANVTYTIDWEPTYVKFSAVTSNGAVINAWNCTNSEAIPKIPAYVIFGIGKAGGYSPSGTSQEIIFDSFQYINSSSPQPVTSSSPVASFTASPKYGRAPLMVNFADQSTGSPTAWSWNFGDGYTSQLKNPTHTYSTVGTYTVRLTVSNENGTSSKTSRITVTRRY